MPLSLALLIASLAVLALNAARGAQATRPLASKAVKSLRTTVDHYRRLTWTYELTAKHQVTPTSFSYRRSSDSEYLGWTLAQWQRHAYRARQIALTSLMRRLDLSLPRGPTLHASLHRRLVYERRLTERLREIYPGTSLSTRSLQSAHESSPTAGLFTWQRRAAQAALAVSRHATRLMVVGPHWLMGDLLCIHHYEGAWNADTGNGYYGGLQMDYGFMQRYGADFLERWGTADNWPAWAQLQASVRAYRSGRGFWPWPNTAQA